MTIPGPGEGPPGGSPPGGSASAGSPRSNTPGGGGGNVSTPVGARGEIQPVVVALCEAEVQAEDRVVRFHEDVPAPAAGWRAPHQHGDEEPEPAVVVRTAAVPSPPADGSTLQQEAAGRGVPDTSDAASDAAREWRTVENCEPAAETRNDEAWKARTPCEVCTADARIPR